MTKRRVFLMLAAAMLTGCDAFVTGEQVVAFDLKPQTDGGYAPVTVTLGPEMNPVALNLRAELPGSGGTPGAWNEYAAMLTFNGAPVATNSFTVNDTSTRDNVPGQPFIARNAITVSVTGLTGCKVPCLINGRKISPVPPARVSCFPATASHALPT